MTREHRREDKDANIASCLQQKQHMGEEATTQPSVSPDAETRRDHGAEMTHPAQLLLEQDGLYMCDQMSHE